ncbi:MULTISPECIES: trigger factor [Sphingomonas]|uniref:trigger factor n=1 Tax=Sphingomonas TaxID=13687 RepID=UPI0008297809|nr:trigger factor [Sphingomonas sp. CCH10-B3]
MQTVETLNEGLKRAYTLKITAKDIEARVDAELKRVAPQIRMPGFRPGKVPANLVRKMHGPAMMQEALNSSVQDGIQSLIAEHGLRPAMQPSIALAPDYELGQDAELTVELEVLPDVPTPQIDGLKLERLTVPVSDEAVDAQLMRFAEQQKRYDDAPEGHAAATGDLVVMDFAGKVAGVAFDGGTGTDMSVELGSGRLIPGFEDQVIGAVKGEERQIAVTFPADYPEKTLAGKDATFDLTIKDVRIAKEATVDEELATSLGLESLEQLRGLLKGQIEQEHNGLTRTHMKRKLLDQLAAGHDFPVPPSMVDAEFQQIWQQLEHEATHEADPAAALAEMETERDDYRKIAERRVRLGLLLSEIGQANGVEVTAQEMNRLIAQAAQQYSPEERQRFIQYVQQEPMAAAQLRAPLYEDKVVDWLFGRAEITDREVSREELEAAIESEDGFATGTHVHDHDHDHDHKPKKKAAKKSAEPAADDAADAVSETPEDAPKPKKAAPKKAKAAEPAVETADAAPAEETPAKKPAARKKKAADEA